MDRRISTAVRLLIEHTGDKKLAVALALDISLAGLYRKLGGGTWRPDEIELVCRRYGVEPNDLFSGQPVIDGQRLTDDSDDDGPDGGKCAIRDSNPEPADSVDTRVFQFRDNRAGGPLADWLKPIPGWAPPHPGAAAETTAADWYGQAA